MSFAYAAEVSSAHAGTATASAGVAEMAAAGAVAVAAETRSQSAAETLAQHQTPGALPPPPQAEQGQALAEMTQEGCPHGIFRR